MFSFSMGALFSSVYEGYVCRVGSPVCGQRNNRQRRAGLCMPNKECAGLARHQDTPREQRMAQANHLHPMIWS